MQHLEAQGCPGKKTGVFQSPTIPLSAARCTAVHLFPSPAAAPPPAKQEEPLRWVRTSCAASKALHTAPSALPCGERTPPKGPATKLMIFILISPAGKVHVLPMPPKFRFAVRLGM